jgi:hypothetical protein
MSVTVPRFRGGGRLLARSGAAGAVGLALTLVLGLAGDPRRALYGYLVAYAFWLGIALGALILLGSFHASSAKWPVVLRRFVESMPLSLPLFAVLALPILLGARHLFPWANPGSVAEEVRHHLERRSAYLNGTGYWLRAIVYFVVWIVVAERLRGWSVRQDATGDTLLTRWQRRLGAGSLPLLALTMSFASFDWMMATDAQFYSTIFGLYWFGGSFMATFAVIAIAAAATRADREQFGAWMTPDHFHSVGKFLLAFVAFWAYMAFSQFLLIWIANIPEEVPWYVVRIRHGWAPVFGFLAIGKFLLPFLVLLSRDLKRSPRALAWIAAWCLLAQWVDLYWLVMPQVSPEGPRPHLADLAAFVGVGGLAIAFTVLRMRGAATVPVADPYLHDSLAYEPR